ncbi:T-cell surface glycoprotein CD8 alpha chain [Erinaceus europaeus]|uniref:T-cell surface glycoprotein CD8 alpha chain n=1 Tax=Erinaceus europaeus TaxID=9365 RepID=A0ABM3X3F5_ERIEU|nr:T-cell surface glycoprotein CD8 alpha chain [Erinaceus europaeus]
MVPLVTALLLPLVLQLHPVASQVSGFRMWPKDGVTAQLGQQVTLRCEVLPRAQQGCSWLFQRPEPHSSPVFLMYIPSTTNTQAKMAEDLNPTQISGKKVSDTCFLTLHKFRKEEEGYYFCFVMNNYKIYFSPFVPVFTPAKPTTTPAPPPPTPAPTRAARPVTVRPEVCRPQTGRAETKGLNFSCDLYIWAPLAGTCGVLLLSVVILIIYNRKNQRRVCKCPRPQVRQAGKSNPSEIPLTRQ